MFAYNANLNTGKGLLQNIAKSKRMNGFKEIHEGYCSLWVFIQMISIQPEFDGISDWEKILQKKDPSKHILFLAPHVSEVAILMMFGC